MAPGYRSPFYHAPSPKPIQDADIIPPAIAIFLCVSIIVCLTLFVFCNATRHNRHKHLQHRDDASVPAQEMVLDQSCFSKNLVVRPGKDLQRAVNESRFDDLQQPLLTAEKSSKPPANGVEMVTPRHDNVYGGAIHWHGINTLNTSWGWMA
ncbi:uncharacterized protein Triagg1_7220 [Trichoderma aggressivum f. europaeum]|uniref:Uncharacterized protein n=1 Tax=Trichoderma aggressivum f. europaeum TaxID=173218 RepID=A0AAE1J641_9HYPO|nr:hypothetical protein Triagg1_7220 [Trichoderma aggressivum f. europaeum]